jgi:hypothetical protein
LIHALNNTIVSANNLVELLRLFGLVKLPLGVSYPILFDGIDLMAGFAS